MSLERWHLITSLATEEAKKKKKTVLGKAQHCPNSIAMNSWVCGIEKTPFLVRRDSLGATTPRRTPCRTVPPADLLGERQVG